MADIPGPEEISVFAETPKPGHARVFRATWPEDRRESHRLRFFLDGSVKTYHLAGGTSQIGGHPMALAQIGAAVIQRDQGGRLNILENRRKVLLLAPRDFFTSKAWEQLGKSLVSDGYLEPVDIAGEDDLATNGQEVKPQAARQKAGGKARHRLHELEAQLIQATGNLRDRDHWLVLDGAAKLDAFARARYLIAVAKSFRRDPLLQISKGGIPGRRDMSALLRELPVGHRTVVFSALEGRVAFWYVRLREKREGEDPRSGVVKVELPRQDKAALTAAEVDQLSRALVAERSIVSPGPGRRGYCQLYPLRMAEQVIRNGFFSQDVLLGSIRFLH